MLESHALGHRPTDSKSLIALSAVGRRSLFPTGTDSKVPSSIRFLIVRSEIPATRASCPTRGAIP